MKKAFISIRLKGKQMRALMDCYALLGIRYEDVFFDDDCCETLSFMASGDTLVVEKLQNISMRPKNVDQILLQAARTGIQIVSLDEPWYDSRLLAPEQTRTAICPDTEELSCIPG